MQPPRLRKFFSATMLAAMLVPAALAHPGHDHSDIPSVIRHPFAGTEHVVVVAALLITAAVALVLAAKAMRASSRHAARPRTARFR